MYYVDVIQLNKRKSIPRNWQQRVYKTKKNKSKTQHNMCWTPLCVSKHEERKQNMILPTNNWGKDEPNL